MKEQVADKANQGRVASLILLYAIAGVGSLAVNTLSSAPSETLSVTYPLVAAALLAIGALSAYSRSIQPLYVASVVLAASILGVNSIQFSSEQSDLMLSLSALAGIWVTALVLSCSVFFQEVGRRSPSSAAWAQGLSRRASGRL